MMMNRREAVASLGSCGVGAAAGWFLHSRQKPCALAGTPLDDLHLYLCAFHVGKDDPTLQVQADHYCMQLSEDLFQCVVMEGNVSHELKPKARILGVEYIVTDKVYQQLSEEEKKYWHPHDYEVTAGLLVAPRLSETEENGLMKSVMTTWGKTVHTWANPGHSLPLGEPVLMWSFTQDGQINPELVRSRDARLRMDTAAVRERRTVAGIKQRNNFSTNGGNNGSEEKQQQ